VKDSPANILFDVNGNPIDVEDDAGTYRLETTSRAEQAAREIYTVDFRDENVATSPEYVLAIDVDNGNGDYPHTAGAGVFIVAVTATAQKRTVDTPWDVNGGVILDIDGTQATLGSVEVLTLYLRSTGTLLYHLEEVFFPQALDLTVSGGTTTRALLGDQFTTTDINTGMTVQNAAGNAVTPGAGDIILWAERVTGEGELEFHYTISYRVA